MPELPEVEITRRGLSPHVIGRKVTGVIVRDRRLRWPVPGALIRTLPGAQVETLERRAKYLLLRTSRGTVILHLGMSGSLRVTATDTAPEPYDHVEIQLDNGRCLRLRDPRRFGCVLWTTVDPHRHPLLCHLGPEPLAPHLQAADLCARSRGRRVAIKHFLMNSRMVAGLGNIYVNEALFLAGIHPLRSAGRIACARYEPLVAAIQQVLEESLRQGGTTLRDFRNGEDRPGYFQLHLRVYQRAGAPCVTCARPVQGIRQGQRSTFYCSHCQR
ncbi:MAG: DNA-formamidopyrimidine glycosylase [Chromatiales bacterium 21-64-14]|nr:MAG: DNA-formamidopyrimidine glycosylase [Chromatiales bacterium 21-64-14]HQU16215.1 bifunctional DNA-formamidopyrimidine glycosylase/DNA-(apurinic or apyrimidinic site) lyase [Gammaproteobacteria bacterium]